MTAVKPKKKHPWRNYQPPANSEEAAQRKQQILPWMRNPLRRYNPK